MKGLVNCKSPKQYKFMDTRLKQRRMEEGFYLFYSLKVTRKKKSNHKE